MEIFYAVTITLASIGLVLQLYFSRKHKKMRKTLNNFSLDDLKVLEMNKMLTIYTASGEEYVVTQEQYDEHKYIVKIDGKTTINKQAIERLEHYSSGLGVFEREYRYFLGYGALRILVEIGGDRDMNIEWLRAVEGIAGNSPVFSARVKSNSNYLEWEG